MKRLEGNNFNNVLKRTKLNAERQRDYRKLKAQEKSQENKTPQAGNSRAAYMRDYRKMMQVERYIYNNVPKRKILNAERERDYRKRKAQENKTS
jgi:hypothetical protein